MAVLMMAVPSSDEGTVYISLNVCALLAYFTAVDEFERIPKKPISFLQWSFKYTSVFSKMRQVPLLHLKTKMASGDSAMHSSQPIKNSEYQ